MKREVAQAKQRCREQLREQLRALDPAARRLQSEQLCARLMQQAVWREADSVLLFAPRPDEPDINPLITAALGAGKQALLPRYRKAQGDYEVVNLADPDAELVTGQYGIREPGLECRPASIARVALVLVPGLGFGRDGRRLGRGKGHYDRLLAQCTGTRCGVAFDVQTELDIPIESHDICMDCLVTPTRWLTY